MDNHEKARKHQGNASYPRCQIPVGHCLFDQDKNGNSRDPHEVHNPANEQQAH